MLFLASAFFVCKGIAELTDEHHLVCGGEIYEFDSAILCGGSVATRIPIQGIDNHNVLTSTEILELEELPENLVIIGGGVIGCEFASAFHAYGTLLCL